MNRATVILLALAILLAHTFAIYQTPDGDIARPYEIAHVAYRLGRNLVYEGAALWNSNGPPVESYPSAIWVLVSAAAARVYLSPILVTQALGLLSALATVIVLAQFSPKRSSGLIAPVLLAASGSAAAAALSGTEAAFAMIATGASRRSSAAGRARSRWRWRLVLTRPEGTGFSCSVLSAFEASRPRRGRSSAPARMGAFVLPGVVVLATLAVRRALTGFLLASAAPLLAPDLGAGGPGLQYPQLACLSGFGLLFLSLILSRCARTHERDGHALPGAGGAWWALVVISGGDELPFWTALVPVLPLFFPRRPGVPARGWTQST
jgi:hypothetical protein